ncbi:hypothetical protein GQ53DRAFT_702566 [Thozetella sp. PMI_491]|nr:hypothetical protein GQ53DRAFT_702566 [Thozetella sp. PMI_491]
MAVPMILGLLALLAVVLGAALRRAGRRAPGGKEGTRKAEKPIVLPSPDGGYVPAFEPLKEFNLNTTKPLRFRPFKPIYHITMALQSSSPSDLIIMDTNYEERILYRRGVIADNPKIAMGTIPEGRDAVDELYTYLMRDYLPARYPSIFQIVDNGKRLNNAVTQVRSPLAPPADPLEAFKILGETIEDDLFLMKETSEGHRVVAFLCCHPSGFDPSSKLGLLLKDVHTPVPSYEKIGSSMERFFSRLEVGKSVKRVNWSITTKPVLFSPDFNHVSSDEVVNEDENIDMEKTRLRIELQTLTRLPETKALLFSFKTYMYPVKEIKDEGLGPDLADAIEGLKRGNAPDMWTYKGAVRWGKSLCAYLRS